MLRSLSIVSFIHNRKDENEILNSRTIFLHLTRKTIENLKAQYITHTINNLYICTSWLNTRLWHYFWFIRCMIHREILVCRVVAWLQARNTQHTSISCFPCIFHIQHHPNHGLGYPSYRLLLPSHLLYRFPRIHRTCLGQTHGFRLQNSVLGIEGCSFHSG